MRTQLITLSIMFVILVLLVPFPEFESLQRIFPMRFANPPVVPVQSVTALEQSISSVDPLEETRYTDEPLISASTSDTEPDRAGMTSGSSSIRETGLEEYQMDIHSGDIRETQVSRSDQHCSTPKRCFRTTSIRGNTMPTRYGFGFNNLIQKQYPVMQRSNGKQFVFIHEVPSCVTDCWNLPENAPYISLDELPIPHQIDDGTFRETGQMSNRDQQHQSSPSVRHTRREAVSL